MEKILLKNVDKPNSDDIQVYLAGGGYSALQKALKTDPLQIINEVKKSALLGRSSAFPVAVKWLSTRQESAEPRYIICNADEGEPGTFKDRILLKKDPHLILEGMIINGYAVGSHQGYIYIRGEYYSEIEAIEKAIRQAESSGYLGKNILGTGFDFEIDVYRGAGAYVCGEETSLMKSMAGLRPSPASKPPFPTQSGFLAKPTIVHNVETLAFIPSIVSRGADWFLSVGNPVASGTKLFCLSGNINRPGVYELPLGINLKDIIDQYGGGVRGQFKMVLPGGVSTSLLTNLNVNMDPKSLMQAGSSVGTGSIIVMNQDVDVIDVAINTLQFFAKESCGKCSLCREGTRQALEILNRFAKCEARPDDMDLIMELNQAMRDGASCVLGQSALNATVSAMKLFRIEFISRVREYETC